MKVFVDTSALFAILDDADLHHDEVLNILDALGGSAELLTTNYVLVEATELVRRRLGPAAASALVDRIFPGLTKVWVDQLTHEAAVAAWRSGTSKVSLVDHVSFVVMRQAGIAWALAFDADFDRQGFRRPSADRGSDARRLSELPATYVPDGRSLTGATELVGVAEIASRSGHPTSTVQSWRRRHTSFPVPFAHLATGPVWHWPTVGRWIRREPRRPGAWRGTLAMAPDFDAPNDDMADLVEGRS